MAEPLECAVAVREISGSSQNRGRHNNLCGLREPSDYVGLRRAVERQWFHTLNTHDTKPRATQHVGTESWSVPTRYRSFPPE